MKKFSTKFAALCAATLMSSLAAFGEYDHASGNITANDKAERYINSIKLTGENGTDGTISGMPTSTKSSLRDVWQDKTGVDPISVVAGDKITITVTGKGWSMHTYFYIDYNGDGTFTPDLNDDGSVKSTSELVSFNYYIPSDNGTAVNSEGTTNTASSVSEPNLPAFTLPSDLEQGKKYRCRYKVDWNNIDAAGSSSIKDDGGEIIDFYIMVGQPNVTFTDPENGTFDVFDTTTSKSLTADSDNYVPYGDVLEIAVSPKRDLVNGKTYTVKSVSANGTELVSEDGSTYSYTVTENTELTAEVVSIDEAKFTVSVAEVANGSFSIATQDGNQTATTGETIEVAYGTDVYISLNPSTPAFYTNSVTANGATVSATNGQYIYNVTSNTIISGEYLQAYPLNTTDTNAEGGNGGRYISSFTLTSPSLGATTITAPDATATHALWQDATTQDAVRVIAGEPISVVQDGSGTGFCSYIYVDINNDRTFGYDVDTNTHLVTESTDVVAFNAFRFGGTSFYDSQGNDVSSYTPGSWVVSGDASTYFPTFTIPAGTPAGKYYARFKADWDNIIPDATGWAWSLKALNAQAIDFFIEVVDVDIKGKVNITAPDKEEGTLRVVNTEDNQEVADGAEVKAGTKLQIIPTATDEYAVSAVSADETTVNADADGNYFYYATGSDVTISATFIAKADMKPQVNISVSGDASTISVKLDDTELVSGDTVAYGSTISIKPSFAYNSEITANNEVLTAKNGVYTYVVENDVNIVAKLTAKYEILSGNTTGTDNRYVAAITVSGENNNSITIETGASYMQHEAWVDRTDHVLTAKAGETIKLTQTGIGSKGGLATYIFVDYDQNSAFDYDQTLSYYQSSDKSESNELVSFSAHKFSSSNYYDYNGNLIDSSLKPGEWLIDFSSDYIPTFKLPASLQPGKYYVRYKAAWNDITPTGRVKDGNGTIIDFVIEVPRTVNVSVNTQSSENGTVVIDNNGESSIVTSDDVTVTAKPDEYSKFLCWSDGNGNIISFDSSYDYTKASDGNLVAHFGYEVNLVNLDDRPGHIIISKNKLYGEAKTIDKAPALRDTDESSDTDSTSLGKVEDISLENSGYAIFEAGETLYINVDATDNDNSSNHLVSVTIRDEEEHENLEYIFADDNTTEDNAVTQTSIEFTANKPYNIQVVFWSKTTGVEDVVVEANSEDGEYYNLNGLRIKSENLTPGIYIRRTTTKAEKVIIK